MLQIIRAKERHAVDFGWLESFHLFSFGGYYDPENMGLGVIRVFNDDRIAPHTGFPEHPHREMEIITIMLTGTLTHTDSMGNRSELKAGQVQHMSAGTGVVHAEWNAGDEEVHLCQIWILPTKKGIAQVYHAQVFDVASGYWLTPIASGQMIKGAMLMNADATIYHMHITSDKSENYELSSERVVFIYITEGEVEINGNILEAGDQLRVTGPEKLLIKGNHMQSVMIDAAT